MKNITYIFIISISLLIFSCQNSTNLGYGIIPEEDIPDMAITDTFFVNVHTIKADSTRTSGVSQLLLGEYIDPVFGHTNAEFVVQFSLGQSVNFQPTNTVDSVVVSLPYSQDDNNIYGNADGVQNVEVYRIETVLHDSVTYYNTQNSDQYKYELIGAKSFVPNPSDSILNITLNNTFGYYLLTADETNYESNENFRNLLKGLFFTSKVQNDDGAVMKFKITQDFVITIYFHDEAGNVSEYKVTANNQTNVRFNIIQHDYTNANFAGTIDDTTLPQDSTAYIQSGGGLTVRVEIPYLKDLQKENKIVVNRAELIIKSAPDIYSYESSYPAVSRMFAANYISSDTALLITDYIASDSYKGESYDNGTYRFNITAFVQEIIDGTTETNGINLYPADDGSDVSRMVITTGNNTNPMKLIVTYTKL